MKVIQSSGKIKLVVVCCLHGDELFGKRVFEHYEKNIRHISGLRLILANEVAMDQNVRFIDEDFNRSFPGDAAGNHEQRLAAELLTLVQDAQYLIDVHTTTSDIQQTPIVANLSRNTKRILNLTTSLEVAYMGEGLADHALIGQVRAGVSLEFGDKYAETDQALTEAREVIDGLLGRVAHPLRSRTVYHIDQSIPFGTPLPDQSQNFKYISQLAVYPFLLGEKSYLDFQGFAASRISKETI